MTGIWKTLRGGALIGALALAACDAGETTGGTPAKTFDIGWSIYVGWVPWPYAEQSGILQKWADKYDIEINLVQVNDYVESINQYTAGTLDGVTLTNMDALTIPAAGGRDTTSLIMGDYSNGNDGIVLKNGTSMADIAGQNVNLVEFSVSHYLLARGLEMNGLELADVVTINTSDADIISAYTTPAVTAVVTWNPPLSEILAMPGATGVFDSSQIPNEIQDMTAISTETLEANPELGMALAGAWFEVIGIMTGAAGEDAAEEAIAAIAAIAGTTPESYKAQLATTYIYADPADAAAYVMSPDMIVHTDRVRQFSFSQGLFGPGAASVDAIGIEFPGGETLGDTDNIKLRFNATYMQMAAEGAL